MIEESRKNKSVALFAKTNGMKSQTLTKLGVTSTFFKPANEEDNLSNHAPVPPEEQPALNIILTEEYIENNPMKVSHLRAIVDSADWIIKTSCIMNSG
jgi:hypothetical protein